MADPRRAPASPDDAILDRLIRSGRAEDSPEAAEPLLGYRFAQRDLDRLNDLVERNREDALSDAEKEELESYLRISSFLDLLHAGARRPLDGEA
jgi:hypothetical protein